MPGAAAGQRLLALGMMIGRSRLRFPKPVFRRDA